MLKLCSPTTSKSPIDIKINRGYNINRKQNIYSIFMENRQKITPTHLRTGVVT